MQAVELVIAYYGVMKMCFFVTHCKAMQDHKKAMQDHKKAIQD